MKKLLFTLPLLFMLHGRINAQQWSQETLAVANTAANATYLSPEEKNIVLYLNLVRTDGALFFNTYFKQYAERHNAEMQQYSNYEALKVDKRSKYYRSLEDDLKKVKGLPLLFPDEKLSAVSAAHAKDLNDHNKTTHNSSDGDSFVQRLSRVYPNKAIAENLAFGEVTGLEIVCALLLDQGVPGLGHRINILNSTYNFSHVGVAIGPHPTYRTTAVIDFIALNKISRF